MLDKCGGVVEPCDVKMVSYIKSVVPNLGQFAICWREEREEEGEEEVEEEKEERVNHSH